MQRISLMMGSVLFDLFSAFTDGAAAVSMLVVGIIVALVHVATEVGCGQWLVNRATGCDLPDHLEVEQARAE